MGGDVTRDINDGWAPRALPEPADGEIDEAQRAAERALAEPDSLSARRVLAQVFERELDEIHTPLGSSYFSAPQEDRSAEERKQREERHLMAAVTAATRRALAPLGIRTETGYAESFGVVQDGEYVLRAKDREGRVFDVKYGLELAQKLIAEGGKRDLPERMGRAIAQQVLAERNRYLGRAGMAPEVA